MSKPVLTYFNGRGRAELARLIFAEAAVEYVDNRVNDTTELKNQGKLAFGQLPLLEWDGLVLVQSISIARYLAKKLNLAGKDDKEAALADMIVDGILDLNGARNAAKTDQEKATFQKETLPKWLGHFEHLLKKNNSGFFVGNDLTWADLAVYNGVFVALSLYPNALDSFPTLKEHYNKVTSRPKIAHWLQTRPTTAF